MRNDSFENFWEPPKKELILTAFGFYSLCGFKGPVHRAVGVRAEGDVTKFTRSSRSSL